MQKHTKIRILTYTTIFLFIIISFLIKPSVSQTSFNWKWSPQVAFRLPAYNTIIAFNDYIYMDSFTWDAFDASAVTFNNIWFDQKSVSQLRVSVENANLTFNSFRNDQLQLSLSTPTGTATATLYVSGYGSPQSVEGASEWGFNPNTHYITVKTPVASTITISWAGTPSAGPPSGGPGGPGPAPTPQPTPLPPVVLPPEAVPLVNVGLIVIVVVVVGAYAYSQITQPKKVSQKWKQKQRQAKPVKWKKKNRFE